MRNSYLYNNQVEAETQINVNFFNLIILTKFSIEAYKVRHNIIWPIRGAGSMC